MANKFLVKLRPIVALTSFHIDIVVGSARHTRPSDIPRLKPSTNLLDLNASLSIGNQQGCQKK